MHHLLHKTWFLGNWLHFSACHSWKWGPQVQRILRSSMFTYFHYWGTPNSNGENHPCSLFLMTISLLWFSGYLWIKKNPPIKHGHPFPYHQKPWFGTNKILPCLKKTHKLAPRLSLDGDVELGLRKDGKDLVWGAQPIK